MPIFAMLYCAELAALAWELDGMIGVGQAASGRKQDEQGD
jgi:hypothetical protein